MKRLVDLVGASVLVLLLMPFLAAIAAAIRLVDGAPVLFRQQRPGLGGKPFTLLKFRTMIENPHGRGGLRPDAERLTSLGRMLRRTSLDELPSLFNVIRGDMSLVGPRPLLMDYLPLYDERQARRHDVRPGLTGLAQVSGRNALNWAERLEYDVLYVETRSWTLDLQILWRTVSAVATGKGVQQPGHATSERFTGVAPPGKRE